MAYHLLPIVTTFLTLALVAAALPPELYWKSMFPTTPMPKAISDLLHPSATGHKGKSVHLASEKQLNTDPNLYNYIASGKQLHADPNLYNYIVSEKQLNADPNLYNYIAGEKQLHADPNLYNYIAGEKQLHADPNLYNYIAGEKKQLYADPNLYNYIAGEKKLNADPNLYNYISGEKKLNADPNLYNYIAGEKQLNDDPNLYNYIAGEKQLHADPNLYNYIVGEKKLNADPNLYNYIDGEKQLHTDPNLYNYIVGEKQMNTDPNLYNYIAGEKQLHADPNLYNYIAGEKQLHADPNLYNYIATEKQLHSNPNLYNYIADPNLYNYITSETHAASKTQQNVDPNVALFFLESDLHAGTKLNLFLTESPNKAKFSPDQTVPLSSDKLPEILNHFSVKPESNEAKIIKNTIKHCEERRLKGEDKHCVTSLESMVDFTISKLGKNVKVIATEAVYTDPKWQNYTIAPGIKEVTTGDIFVVCHKEKYPSAVFACHRVEGTRAYFVPIEGDDGSRVKAVAVCHKDTSEWNPNHVVLRVLKVKPGVPVCHILPDNDHLVWVPSQNGNPKQAL